MAPLRISDSPVAGHQSSKYSICSEAGSGSCSHWRSSGQDQYKRVPQHPGVALDALELAGLQLCVDPYINAEEGDSV